MRILGIAVADWSYSSNFGISDAGWCSSITIMSFSSSNEANAGASTIAVSAWEVGRSSLSALSRVILGQGSLTRCGYTTAIIIRQRRPTCWIF